ncbi:predicted protein [Histoplasma capsulatum var. duboisii H88]|uniref:Killer toxin Kp4 domain-containing protein n=4 Tax=Ajellomyces capsulatus TaxID=5037 RepID=C0NZ22_AJECG|nr:uncharacterized protein HCBG_08402 [Histoplasma capsulatum G186AR]EER44889.1 predicted protein [Histoplasma capsulatum H143]EGC45434.1 predicted protein [Histoplasma capsulatum var. duboisii H88]KAG5295873.1 hypothetical protein I7I52_06296 [Histoplasma capsulatum]EEH03462.1 predicted protein [Histoplasma capsulatum G186AR]QSS73856.1 hypothetical protein I7I50_08782 [Histoplasma capsulatum G186AR]
MKISIVLPAILALSTATSATDCYGSSRCQVGGCQLSDVLNAVPARNFQPGERIACCSPRNGGNGLCAWATHSNGYMSWVVARNYIQGLMNYGCRRCGHNGSVRVDVP